MNILTPWGQMTPTFNKDGQLTRLTWEEEGTRCFNPAATLLSLEPPVHTCVNPEHPVAIPPRTVMPAQAGIHPEQRQPNDVLPRTVMPAQAGIHEYKKIQDHHSHTSSIECSPNLIQGLNEQLSAYFFGNLKSFNIPLAFESGTLLQQKVWAELVKIPYGERISYTELAQRVGSHPRPVANAVGKNPLPIVVPCHRVVAKNNIGGYTAPKGLCVKIDLLNIEKKEERK